MEQDQKNGKQPDYRGKLDIAAWANTDKNGKIYFTVRFANSVNLFKNEPRQQQQGDQERGYNPSSAKSTEEEVKLSYV